MPITLLLVVIFTISSCTKKDECTMCGTYNGNIKTNDTLKIHVGNLVNLDTTFSTMSSKAVISDIEGVEDSMIMTVSLELAGTPVDVAVTAFKASDTKLVVKDATYTYTGIDIRINGDFIQDGNNATANVILSPLPNSSANVVISGDLAFTGTK